MSGHKTRGKLPDLKLFWTSVGRDKIDHLLTVVTKWPEHLGLNRKDPAYWVLCVLVASQHNLSTLFVSHAQLSKETGVCERTVRRALAYLAAIGYIQKTPQSFPYKGFANGYSVHPLAEALGVSWGPKAEKRPNVPPVTSESKPEAPKRKKFKEIQELNTDSKKQELVHWYTKKTRVKELEVLSSKHRELEGEYRHQILELGDLEALLEANGLTQTKRALFNGTNFTDVLQ